VKLVWASAAEGNILAEEIDKMVAEVKALGPLNWKNSQQSTVNSRQTAVEGVAA
jgi:hypothetical protein